MKKKIAIIGSGVGGLTAANLLIKNSDFEVVVYEKEKMLSLDEGYGIQLATNSVSILNKVGFRDVGNNDIFNPLKLNFDNNVETFFIFLSRTSLLVQCSSCACIFECNVRINSSFLDFQLISQCLSEIIFLIH